MGSDVSAIPVPEPDEDAPAVPPEEGVPGVLGPDAAGMCGPLGAAGAGTDPFHSRGPGDGTRGDWGCAGVAGVGWGTVFWGSPPEAPDPPDAGDDGPPLPAEG